jgi:hypothetical protein
MVFVAVAAAVAIDLWIFVAILMNFGCFMYFFVNSVYYFVFYLVVVG